MPPVPPKINPSRRPLLVLGAALAGIAAVIFFFNPATAGIYPACQFHRLTGLNCPGCGMTRAAYALLHGKFLAALRDNALFVLAVAGVAGRGGWLKWKQWRGRARGEFLPVKYFWPLLAVALVFTVLRNLPAFAFLSP